MKTPVSKPIAVTLPARGVAFAESVHGPRFRMTERADPFHKLIYVLQGKIAFTATSAAKPLHAAAGTTLCVRAGVAHRIADAAPPTPLLLCFAPEFLADDPARARLWAALTGGLLRFGFEAGLGVDFRLTRAVSLGPVLRYVQVVEVGGKDRKSVV